MEGNMIVLNDVTERVRYYARRSAGDMLELGKALTEAKELVPHGEWEGYVKENAGMELRMAQNFMQAYRKWGTGNPDLSRLNVGQMIALLPASSEEIEKISEDKDLSGMSSREIKAAIQKARREGKAEAEEEQAERNRETMQLMANDKARELARQKESYEARIKEERETAKAEANEQLEALKTQLAEQKAAANDLRKRAEQAEENARAAIQEAIDNAKDISAQSNSLEEQKRKFQQEIADRDAAIEELQRQYDEVNQRRMDLESTIARGDAERTSADILSAESMQDAVNMFLGQVGRVPYMHGAFSMMDNRELEDYRACIRQVMDWAEKSLKAVEAVNGRGVVE